ncbi:MAG: glycosyltransferase family 4 protein [Caldilineaceae bacterium]
MTPTPAALANLHRPRHIVINGWFLGRHDAGSGQYLHHLLDHLPVHALEHLPTDALPTRWTVLVPRTTGAAMPDSGRPHMVVAPLDLPPLPTPLRKLWWEQVMIPVWAARLRADLLWVPYWAAPLYQPVPTVVTVHDLSPLLLPGYGEGRAQKAYNRLVSASARRAGAVITVSHAAARDIVTHLGVAGDHVHVVHHGPNQPTQGAALDESILAATSRRLMLPERFFLYLGGFETRKNLRTTLAAYKRYLELGGDPTVRLVIAGRLPTQDTPFAPDPRRLAADLGLESPTQVHFAGWVDEADKPALYALSLGYLFPSLYEGFGMMVLEAQQAGTPVITSA